MPIRFGVPAVADTCVTAPERCTTPSLSLYQMGAPAPQPADLDQFDGFGLIAPRWPSPWGTAKIHRKPAISREIVELR